MVDRETERLFGLILLWLFWLGSVELRVAMRWIVVGVELGVVPDDVVESVE